MLLSHALQACCSPTLQTRRTAWVPVLPSSAARNRHHPSLVAPEARCMRQPDRAHTLAVC